MKINLTLDVSSSLRKLVAKSACEKPLTAAGEAHRSDCVDWIKRNLEGLDILAGELQCDISQPLTDADTADARDAIEYLRARGKKDSEIRAWLMLQKARYDILLKNKPHQADRPARR